MFALDRLTAQTRFAVIAALALLFAGCSGDDNVATVPATAAAAPPASANNTPPSSSELITLQGTPPSSAYAGTEYNFEPQVSRSSTLITFAITGQPSWARFDTSSGTLSGTPAARDEGTTGHITITASNGSATASITPFTIRVNSAEASSGSAALSWLAPTENTDGTPITDLAGYHIYYGTNASELTTAVNVVGATSTKYIVSGLRQGTYYFAVLAYNSAGMDSGQSNIAHQTI